VTFRQAKFKEIAAVTLLFQKMLDHIPQDRFKALLAAIVEAQHEAMAAGRAPGDLSLNATRLVDKAFGQTSVLLTIFASVMDILPEFVPQFCDLSAADFNELDLDEAVLVAAGVVAVNYAFFSQKLPPLVQHALRGWQSRSASAPLTAR
jgi:hypothetical protein